MTLKTKTGKQLFFKSKVVLDLEDAVTWDYSRYPFDQQMVRATVQLLDEGGFADKTTYERALMDLFTPTDEYLMGVADKIYRGSDWSIYSASMVRQGNSTSSILIELMIARNAQTTIFKVMVPMIAVRCGFQFSAPMGFVNTVLLLRLLSP